MAGMPYVHDRTQVSRVLDLVLNATTPAHVTPQHLENNGFPMPAAAQVWGFLRAMGLLDADGIPSDRWTAYRDADDPPSVLHEVIADRYAPLVDQVGAGAPTDAELETAVGSDQQEHAAHVVATFRALCRRAGIVARVPRGPVRPRREVLHDIGDLLRRSVDEFEQARRCLAHDLTRPAHVAAWNSFVALAFAQLADDDFAALRTSKHRAELSLDDLMRAVHGRELIRLLARHELVAADDGTVLDDVLRRRNDCAHPMPYEPDLAETATYLSSILSLSASLTEQTAPTAPEAPSTPPPPTTPR